MAGTLSENARATPAEKRRRRDPGAAVRPAALVALVSLGAAVLLVLLVALIGPSAPPPPAAVTAEAPPEVQLGWQWLDPPRALPPVGFTDAGGQARSLDEFRGRVLLVNFWATWCAPCVRELPALDRLSAQQGGPDLQVLALSVDRGGQAVTAPFLARNQIADLPVYFDPNGDAMRAFGVAGLPATALIDRDGRWLGTYLGPAEWDDPAVLAPVTARIAGRPAAGAAG